MSKIILKQSSVPGNVPTDLQLDYGEVAINTADNKMYIKNSGNDAIVAIASGVIYDIAGSTLSQPTDAAVLMRFVTARGFSLPASIAGSRCESNVATTAITVYSIKRGGTEVGTITFPAAGNTGTFAGAGGAFVVGDILTVEAPATADATHDDIAWTLAAQL